MDRVTSRDGTPIAYEAMGAGPPLVLVGGGLDDGSGSIPGAVRRTFEGQSHVADPKVVTPVLEHFLGD